MRRYFSKEDFVTFINLLEENKSTKVFTECLEDNSIQAYNFMKINFSGNIIVLYDHPACYVGIIQDTPVAPIEDYSESVYDDFECNGDFKIFIESE